jgi:Tfp pilus assembly protein PilN
MIRVNLSGTSRKKAGKAAARVVPQSVLPVLLLAIIAGAAAGGYWWYSDTSTRLANLNDTIAQAEAQRQALEEVIKQDQIYESRKAIVESRIKIIEGLQRNQVSPVVSLDFLAQAVSLTQYVWLSSLDQNNTLFSMSGVGTSVNAIADFVTNLENTRYFRNINLVNAQDSQGNFTFTMTCEFAPPQVETPEAASTTPAAPAAGGN